MGPLGSVEGSAGVPPQHSGSPSTPQARTLRGSPGRRRAQGDHTGTLGDSLSSPAHPPPLVRVGAATPSELRAVQPQPPRHQAGVLGRNPCESPWAAGERKRNTFP